MSHSTQGNPQGAQLLDRCTGKTWLLLCIRNARCRMASTPGRNWVVLDVAARHRMVVRTESLRIPNRHDTGSTSPRSVGEVALGRSRTNLGQFIAPAHPRKKERIARDEASPVTEAREQGSSVVF